MDLESVITGAISGIEGSEAEAATDAVTDQSMADVADTSGDVVDVSGATEVVQDTVTDPLSDDPLAKELGLKSRADGKENRIPYSRVKMITANAEKKAVQTLLTHVAEATGLDVKALSPEKLKDILTERETGFQSERAEVTQMRDVEKVMASDPDRFMQMLTQVNPAYAKFLGGGAAAAETATTAPTATTARPQPDLDLGNGQKTYSLDGIENLVNWSVSEGVRQAVAQFEGKVKPLQDRQAEADAAAQAAERTARQTAASNAAWQEAYQNWDGFKENASEILAVLKADVVAAQKENRRVITLDRAYNRVVLPKMKADREKTRAEVLAELRKAPASTSTAAQTQAGAAADTGPKSVEDIIKASIAGIKR